MLKIFQQGDARAIGVSNYGVPELQEFLDAGLPLPSVNQCPFNIHRSSAQQPVRDFCKQHNILFNGYSPLGIPDITVDVPAASSLILHKYPAPMTASELDEPAVKAIAAAHGRSPAQVLLNWQYSLGIPTNPRSSDPAHMLENLNIFSFQLTPAEIQVLSTLPQDYCDLPDKWYECVPRGGMQAPQFNFSLYSNAMTKS
jgi:diketogulonate reductase-like aldo/keto reductase